MHGRNKFTKSEAKQISNLLQAKNQASRNAQKQIRSSLRKKIGFYISDFDSSQSGFTSFDFENLIKIGKIMINDFSNGDTKTSNENMIVHSDSIRNISAEETRNKYKPMNISVLYVGESPPAGGTFFYNANSNLFRYLKKAFLKAFEINQEKGFNFLDFFKENKCYLDDLCLVPVNKKSVTERNKLRKDGIISLAKRIREYQPNAIVILMKAIEFEVKDAIYKSGKKIEYVFTTPFPSFSDSNKQMCVNENIKALQMLIRNNVI